VLARASRTDDQIPLPIVDVNGRQLLGYARYSDVWRKGYRTLKHSKKVCADCAQCQVADNCPTGAFKAFQGIDLKKCVRCGVCLTICPRGALQGDLGAIELGELRIPVTLRQSDSYNAERLTRDLKKSIEKGEFSLSSPVQAIKPK
jgi:ferredoxin